jgi:hypothetical protein
MKILKFSESLKNSPVIGDYVICKTNEQDYDQASMKIFLENNIGKVVKIYHGYFPTSSNYIIEYNNVPKKLKHRFTIISQFPNCVKTFFLDEILYWDNDKEKIEAMINANKYNL